MVDKYNYPKSTANYDVAERRLKDLKEGSPIIATDGIYYEIKDNKVITRLTNSKRAVSIADVKN